MSRTGLLVRQCEAWGVPIGPDTERLLYQFAGLLSEYDKANVIGTREFERILVEHVLDSLSCLLFRPLKAADRIADIGSGGGLPGIPLKIALPSLRISLFEATGKKADFLEHTTTSLGLRDAAVFNERVEEAGRQQRHREAYEICTVRALAGLSVISEYCLPLLRLGGHVVAMKAAVSDEEWLEGERAAALLGGRLLQAIEVPSIPGLTKKARRLVILQKTSKTPVAYPRKVGVPAKKPLGKK